MAGRRAGAVLLSAGLVVITLAGGAGGYGIGHLTQPKAQPSGSAAPLHVDGGDGTPTPVEPVNTAVPDPTPALRRSELRYKEREFVAEQAVRSRVTAEVPKNWRMTQPDPPKEARYTDPTARRYVRIEAGFTIERPPQASMEQRILMLANTPSREDLRILNTQVTEDGRSATLTYTFIPTRADGDPRPQALRYVVVRWVALDDSGDCAVEISSTGLIQDKDAIWAVLERASDTVTRSDSEL
ncbi:hypothetical protein [Kribbella sp. ALI-6-A]|uniref:hypothetical protein n=1 Tax=Kribbella sp. ALI-6-A TaxID=1933817 RepID=UPI00117A3590|nr:hypothetical protein [Kribbella sp. ALI-6-A]